jgi:predicted DNA-binding protein (UPF0251 family)
MPRPCKNRFIRIQPVSVVYKPIGVPTRKLEWVTLHLDELEAIRLLDHLGLDQEQTAGEMDISRSTVTRIYASARRKIAHALVLGKAICIEGGPVAEMPDSPEPVRGMVCGKEYHQHAHGHSHYAGESSNENCGMHTIQ